MNGSAYSNILAVTAVLAYISWTGLIVADSAMVFLTCVSDLTHQKCIDLHSPTIAQTTFRVLRTGKLEAQDCGVGA